MMIMMIIASVCAQRHVENALEVLVYNDKGLRREVAGIATVGIACDRNTISRVCFLCEF